MSTLTCVNVSFYCVTASALDIQYEKRIDYGCSWVVCCGGVWVDGWGLGVASR